MVSKDILIWDGFPITMGKKRESTERGRREKPVLPRYREDQEGESMETANIYTR